MKKNHLYFLLFSLMIAAGCSSPKNQFEKGNYEKAVQLSINKLRKKPSNEKQQSILKAAYGYAVKVSAQKIILYQQSKDRFQWDKVIAQYQQMQKLYRELLQCPGCLNVVTPVDYQTNLNEALVQGAQVHVEEGLAALTTQTKAGGRTAFNHFAQAKTYQNDYANIDEYLAQAKRLGTEIIGISKIPVASKGLEINSAFFLQQLTQALNDLNYRFAEFYPLDHFVQNPDGKENKPPVPDQIIDLSFDDYYIGQTYLKETRETVVRDSVKVGKVTDSLGRKRSVFGKVEAELQLFNKTLESGGLLNIVIVEPATNAVLFQQKIPSTYVWENHWATYQGDKRALTKAEIDLTKNKELLPPAPQELFYAFTRPLFDQTAELLRRRYHPLK
ncbi:MAG: hypothetical protein ACPHUE_05380 [Flavobacteriaceae bacterium]